MKHSLLVLVLPLVLLCCERDHGGDHPVTPPDAPGEASDTGPDPGPGPGAGNPLEPDQRVECALEPGYVSALQDGREVSRTTNSIAALPEGEPPGTAWLCREQTSGCGAPSACRVNGEVRLQRCGQTLWSVTQDGEFYIHCGSRVENDPDGDGVFTVFYDTTSPDIYVTITRP